MGRLLFLLNYLLICCSTDTTFDLFLREAGDIFTQEEKAVLGITEEITLIHQKGLSDETYSNALQFFSESEIADIITAVIAINLWNRVVLSTRLPIGQSLA
ncbi:carboxymuconolactone decarboxylase family protein [Flavobacterium phragmitis]|uniref:Alkylhydroperoxidase AhpD family core domain-containing protein n=1 Tax=Flavobacterium phragmitis TaxID=739143 RepID=A0A1I1LVJ9_9FLAO|nr:hypothetical protein [Flavobacterium phragmitis]SFC73500.1 hypothetical protein SAMN05216297_10269 [Flavobacterium phragmitis]